MNLRLILELYQLLQVYFAQAESRLFQRVGIAIEDIQGPTSKISVLIGHPIYLKIYFLIYLVSIFLWRVY